VHDEHNKPKRSGAFFLIILGAILFFIAPTTYTDNPEFGTMALISGFLVGGLGFYLHFLRKNRST